MAIIRSIILILIAALLGVTVTSLLFWRSVEGIVFAGLVFAIPGTALIATSTGVLLEAGYNPWFTRLLVFAEGVLVGAALIWLPNPSGEAAGFGAAFGAGCTMSWIALDFIAKRLRAPSPNPASSSPTPAPASRPGSSDPPAA